MTKPKTRVPKVWKGWAWRFERGGWDVPEDGDPPFVYRTAAAARKWSDADPEVFGPGKPVRVDIREVLPKKRAS